MGGYMGGGGDQGLDMPPMSGICGGSPEVARLIAALDPMGMGDVQRGAQVFLELLNEDPRELATILHNRYNMPVPWAFMRTVRAQSIAILRGGQGGLGMPGQMGSGIGGGMRLGAGGSTPGGMSSPRMGGARASLQERSYGTMRSRPGTRSAVEDYRPRYRPDPGEDDEFDEADDESRGSRLRRFFRRGRDNALSYGRGGNANRWDLRRGPPDSGGRGGSSGPWMYGAFLGFGRL